MEWAIKIFFLNKSKDIKKIFNKFINSKGPSLLEVEIEQKSMKNLLRPKSLYEIKKGLWNKIIYE